MPPSQLFVFGAAAIAVKSLYNILQNGCVRRPSAVYCIGSDLRSGGCAETLWHAYKHNHNQISWLFHGPGPQTMLLPTSRVLDYFFLYIRIIFVTYIYSHNILNLQVQIYYISKN